MLQQLNFIIGDCVGESTQDSDRIVTVD